MLSDRPFADSNPIRLGVQPPDGRRGFPAEDSPRIKRETRAEFADAPQRNDASDAAPAASAPPPGDTLSGKQHRAMCALWRHACDWFELHRICRQARCRRAGRCRGEPVGCLRAGARRVPQPARDFVRAMMQAQELGLPFEEAFEDADDYHDGYFGWLAGLAASRQRSR